MQIGFLIQARLGSTRLPNKILESVYKDTTLLEMVIKNLLKSKYAKQKNIIVLTTTNSSDDKLVSYLEEKNINYFRGSEDNVFSRYYNCLKDNKFDAFFRICSDNPFIDYSLINNIVNRYIEKPTYDYYSYELEGTPAILTHFGFFAELINYSSFTKANSVIKQNDSYYKEHVTPIFYKNKNFKTSYLKMPNDLVGLQSIRTTVDTLDDLINVKSIYSNLNGDYQSYKEVLNFISNNESLKHNMLKNIELNRK